jgi:hypothetical protein
MTGSSTATSTFSRGWASYLTLYSAEKNARIDGTPRVVLNGTDLNKMKEDLDAVFDESWTNFILAYRIYGASQAQSTGPTADPASVELDLNQQPQGTFTQVLDLIGAQVQITQNGQQVALQSPFANSAAEMAVYLPLLMENCTVNDATTIPGRININEAPIDILLGIPGMTEDIVNEITSRRTEEVDETDQNRQYETWLLTEGIVTLEEMRMLTPFINAGGDVFRAQIVGYYQGGGPSSRAEVIFDATGTTPRVLFWRDMSHLGRGYALETLGVDLVEPTE